MRTGRASSLRRQGASLLAVILCAVVALPAQALTSNTRVASSVRVAGETVCTGVFEVGAQPCTGLFAADNPANLLDPSGKNTIAEQVPVAGTIGYLAGQLAVATVKALVTACAAELVVSGTANVVLNVDTTGIPRGPTTVCAWRGRKRDDNTPIMYYSLTEFPVIAAHIKEHQFIFPVHKTLHYLGPLSALADLNRRRAYGDLALEPLDPVPQQAAPDSEQRKQGGKHTAFYTANKLKTGDAFKVEVIP